LKARINAPLSLPYLSGERTPHNNPKASGSLLGLRREHGTADVAYAVLEGITFGLLIFTPLMMDNHWHGHCISLVFTVLIGNIDERTCLGF
jgi:glycerol kinase